MPISSEEQTLFEAYRRWRILEHIDNARLPSSVIMVICGDGDHVSDKFGYQEQLCRWKEETPRIHLIAMNGGALLIPGASPLCEDGAVMRRHIAKARVLKNINDVVLYVHAPCGVAREFGLGFEDIVGWLMAAKRRLKSEHPDIGRIFPFLHVHRQDGAKNTYFVSKKFWMRRGAESVVRPALRILFPCGAK